MLEPIGIWTQCFLAYLKDKAEFQRTGGRREDGRRVFDPGDYESYLTNWYNDFCND
jgi:hypothetical protein